MTAERRVRLDDDPRSVRTARRVVTEVLVAAGRPELVDDAVLATSEVVTNVVLHAGTPSELSVRVLTAGVRVEVRDYSREVPTARRFGELSTTGRGMLMLAVLSRGHGVTQLPDGKVVWFEVGSGPRPASGPAADDGGGLVEPGVVAVLRGVPALLWSAGVAQWAAGLRELFLVRSAPTGPAVVRELDLAGAGAALSALAAAGDRALSGSGARSHDCRGGVVPPAPSPLDLEVRASTTSPDPFHALQDALDVGLRLARGGELLARAALAEVTALRAWACQEAAAQAAGAPARPYPAYTPAVERPGLPPGWDGAGEVSGADEVVVAMDDGGRLLAASPAAARLLGDPGLVGRPVTAVLPARLRETVVAALCRHRTTGTGLPVDVPLRLQLLRSDGGEVAVTAHVSRRGAAGGRTVFVARVAA